MGKIGFCDIKNFALRVWLITMIAAVVQVVMAQDDVEYRYDIGAGVVATTYYGDFNSRLMGNIQPGGAAMFRKIINPRSAVRLSGMVTKVKGSYDKALTDYPDIDEAGGYEFNSTIGDLSAMYEYNFWAFGTGHDYRGAQRIAPFISLGVGLTYVSSSTEMYDYTNPQPQSSTKSLVSANVPIGFGVKFRVKDRLNVTVDWQMHFSLTDQLDGVKDPYRVKSNGIFKNTDCYSTLMVALTYCFSAKCPTCMKDR